MCTGHLSDLHLVHKNSPTEPYQIVKVDNKNFYNTTDGGCVPSVETHHVVLLQTKTPADETLLKIHNDLLAMGITILPKNDLSGMHFNAWWFLFSCKHWNGKKNYMDGLLLSFFHLCKKSTFFKTLKFIKTHISFSLSAQKKMMIGSNEYFHFFYWNGCGQTLFEITFVITWNIF